MKPSDRRALDGSHPGSAQAVESAAAGNVWVLIAAILGSSLAFIDGTVVNIALPSIQSGLHATSGELQWVVESYALSLASLLLVGGSFGDSYGRKMIFLFGTVLFAIGSAWCAFAGSIEGLIAARTVQGIGAAFLVPGSLSLISSAYPPSTRGRAIGTWSGFTAMMGAGGPVLGGWLVEHFSWRSVFMLNLPLAAVVVGITLWRVNESKNEKLDKALDWPGALLASVGLGGITYALIEASEKASGVLLLLAASVGVIALIAFLVREARCPAPMVPLALFKSRTFAGANLITFFLYSGLGGILYFLPFTLIQIHHYSAAEAGAALLPLILIIFVLSRWTGGLVATYGARAPLTVGSVIVAAGFALLAWPGVGGSYLKTFFAPVVVLGLGMAICVAPLTTSVMNAVPENQSGVASGVNNAVSRVAGLLAVALFGLVLSMLFNKSLDLHLLPLGLSQAAQSQVNEQRALLGAAVNPDARVMEATRVSFVFGFRVIVLIASSLALASAISAWLMLDHDKTRRQP
jgi:EmrB/QacA subfamily drug resistance transporter